MPVKVTTRAVVDMNAAKGLVGTACDTLIYGQVMVDNGQFGEARAAFEKARTLLDLARGYCELSRQYDLVEEIVILDARIRALSVSLRAYTT